MTINLANLDLAEAGEVIFDLEILHPKTDEPTGMFVQIVGMHSEAVRDIVRRNTNEILKRDFEAQRKGGSKPPTMEESDRRGADVLAAGTVGWFTKEISTKPGEADKIVQGLPFGETRLQFSRSEAVKLYTNPGYEWLRKQVDKGIGDAGNFLPG